jgi:general secretion pathway protein J
MQPLTQPLPFGTEHRLVRRQPVAQSARKAWPRNCALGFTLVEVLVALASMALLSVLSWQGIDTLLRTREITQSQVNDTALVQASLRQWHMDWDAIQPLPDLLPQGSVNWDGRVMRMLRRSPTPQASGADGGVLVVAWTQRNGHWWRWQSNALFTRAQVQHAWQAAAQWGHHPVDALRRQETRLMAAQAWQIFYYRDNSWSHPMSSNDPSQRPPDGVRIVLQPIGKTTAADKSALTVDWVHPAFNPHRT